MTDSLQRAIAHNYDFITKAFLPYDAIARQFEALGKVIAPPSSILLQMQSVFSGYDKLLPKMAESFQIASAVFDSVRMFDFAIPDYLAHFNYDFRPLLTASGVMRGTYDSLIATVDKRTVAPEVALSR